MDTRFDDTSSGSEDEEAPQLEGMTSSDEDSAYGDGGDDGEDDAGVLEVRNEERVTMDSLFLHWPAKNQNNEEAHLVSVLTLPLSFSSLTTLTMTIRHRR